MTKKKGPSAGHSMGGILVGFDQQIFRTTPPVNELVAKGAPLPSAAAAGGGRLTVGMPDDGEAGEAGETGETAADSLELAAPGVTAAVDLVAGGRLASLVIDGREILKTAGDGPITWGSFPMAPFAGRVRDGLLTFAGEPHQLPMTLPPHAIHGTVLGRRWAIVGEATIATDLGPDWPFRGRAVQAFELAPDHLTCRLAIQADEPMPASIGWHPYFVRRIDGAGPLELDLDAGAMLVRDAAGIATDERVTPGPGPWDDCFLDLRRPPVLRWPGFLELAIESDCPAWVVYTAPEDTICVEPQSAPPNAVNTDPTVVRPGSPLVAEMTWRWRSIA